MFIGLLLVFFAQAQNNQDPCTEALRSADVYCNVVDYACDNISKCIARRDSCVSKVPKSNDECVSLNPCMETFNRQSGQGTCAYQWDPSRRECTVAPKPFRNTKLCPGRYTGLASVIIQGFDYFHDANFDCKAVVGYYKKEQEKCAAELKIAARVCRPNQLTSAYNRHKNYKCSIAQTFSVGAPLPSANVNDMPRGESDKPASGSTPSGGGPQVQGL